MTMSLTSSWKPNATIEHANFFVASLMDLLLPDEMTFHNIDHTRQVVEATYKISKHVGINKYDEEIVVMAAWFHDVGHIASYDEHEAVSQEIAESFLKSHQWTKKRILKVIHCIEATKIPQDPQNILEAIICDADLYHLSSPDYFKIQKHLRREWALVLDQKYTDEEWEEKNLAFLKEHQYWTPFGRSVLEKRKQANIEQYQNLIK